MLQVMKLLWGVITYLSKSSWEKRLNDTVNNWSTEIESFTINFVHISGKDNVIADILRRLIDMDPDLKQQPELKDHDFGKYCFKTLPKVKGYTYHQKVGGENYDVCEIQITYDNDKYSEFSIELPLDDGKFISLQEQELKIWELWDKVKAGMYSEFYIVIKNGGLFDLCERLIIMYVLYEKGYHCRPPSRINAWLMWVVWDPYYRILHLSLGCGSCNYAMQ